MKVSEFCFKVAVTCLVLVAALGLIYWISTTRELIQFIIGIAAIGFIGLVIGIISSIWE